MIRKFFLNIPEILRGLLYKLVYLRRISGKRIRIGKRANFILGNEKIELGEWFQCRSNLNLRVVKNGKFKVGNNVFFNDNCCITVLEKVKIGDFSSFGQGVCIYDHDHIYKTENLTGKSGYNKSSVIIGKNVWVGANCTILKGSHIGDNSVIAAGTVVRGKIPANSLVYNQRDLIIKNIKYEN